MTETVVLPSSRKSEGGRFILPLLILPFLVYNGLALTLFGGSTLGWTAQLFAVPMVSGTAWALTASDLLLVIGLVALFFEVLKSTNAGRASVIEHMASVALFVVFLVEFLLVAPAASSTFFILMAMSLVDVVAGFTISITGAHRDVTMA